MPQIVKTLYIDVTPEKFLDNCSREELLELEILLSSPRYQERMGKESDEQILHRNFLPEHEAAICCVKGCTNAVYELKYCFDHWNINNQH